MRFLRRFFVIVIVLAAIALIALLLLRAPRKDPLACSRCNVILVSIDSLGEGEMDGSDASAMPALLRRAAASGIAFTRAYAQSSWTFPSDAAMLTGRYPWDLGIWTAYQMLPPGTDTLADEFKNAGYRTALFSDGPYLSEDWGLASGFDETYGSIAENAWKDTPQIFTESAAWIQANASSTAPFFMTLRPFAAHDPFIAADGTAYDINDLITASGEPGTDAGTIRAAYEHGLKQVDDGLDAFFTALDTAGLASSTVVLVTSEHGLEFGEHGITGLPSIGLYDRTIRVPFVLFLPGAPAKQVPYSIETRSAFATLLSTAGLTVPGGVAPGILPFIDGTEHEDRTALAATGSDEATILNAMKSGYADYASMTRKLVPASPSFYRPPAYTSAATNGSLTALWHAGNAAALYDLASDPDETEDLAPSTGTLPGLAGVGQQLLLMASHL